MNDESPRERGASEDHAGDEIDISVAVSVVIGDEVDARHEHLGEYVVPGVRAGYRRIPGGVA